ncbi:pentapeptide repeat-containing protein [Sediminibacter sp. Hel_I_10]|uniref:pentapeptide repeat-containing protein n=1 Tax=Sediminibacter sp. Hel_I_10 TaxID=1392490 RepID=UPI00047C7823|nr:pentapeptide repeat-containing protein [Sediminibacter sp. Hel_I_10]
MKPFVMVWIALIQLSCATPNSPTKENRSMKALIKNDQPVYFENETFNERIDFTSFLDKHLISEGIYKVKVNSGITFKNCIFNKPVTAFKTIQNGSTVLASFGGNVSFINCIFKDTVNFRGSSIYGRTDFTRSTFRVEGNFEELNCHENAFFNGCIFEGPARFQNSFFNQKSNFMSVECYDAISFQNALFNSELQFGAGKFFKYADFTLIDCRGKVFFNYAEFKGKAEFSYAIFAQDFDFVNTNSHTVNFNSARFLGMVRFNKAEVKSSINLKDAYFLFETPDIDSSTQKLPYSK